MKIELTAEELRLIVYALKAASLREAALDLDNPDSGPCWDLSEKMLQRTERARKCERMIRVLKGEERP